MKNKNLLKVTIFRLSPILLVFFFVNAILPSAMGDRGGFSPIAARVTETAQKAIIAWNATREVIILSTDVSSSNESEVIEIMPLPSSPTISKGEMQSFWNVRDLVNLYFDLTAPGGYYRNYQGPLQTFGNRAEYMPKMTITLQEEIGVHFLTVVKAEDSEDLMLWLNDFLASRGYAARLPSGLNGLLGKYIQDNVNFFSVDVIETNSSGKTVDPLVYEFDSPNLYYPLRISSLFYGDTSISLFTITSSELKEDSLLGGQFSKKAQFQVKKDALASINANITLLFSVDPYLAYYTFWGPQDSFTSDILATLQSGSNSPIIIVAALSMGWGLAVLFMLFSFKKGSTFEELGAVLTRRLHISSLLTGLIGVSLACSGFVLPWGLGGFGENGELLVILDGLHAPSQFGIISFLSFLLILAAVACYSYLFLVGGNSKRTAVSLTILGAGSTTLPLDLWSSLHTADAGTFAILAGGLFMIVAGLLSLWRLGLQPQIISPTTKFRDYVIRRFLTFIVTLIGVLVVLFWLYSLSPWGIRYTFPWFFS